MLPNLSSIPISLRSADNCLKQLKMVRTSQHLPSTGSSRPVRLSRCACCHPHVSFLRRQMHAHNHMCMRARMYVKSKAAGFPNFQYCTRMSACMAYASHHHQDHYVPQVVLQCMPACKIPRRCPTGSYILLLSYHHMYTSRHDDPRQLVYS